MTRSHYLSVLALALAVAACDSERLPTEPLPQADNDAVTNMLVSMTGSDPRADSRGGNSLFDRLAGEIEGFGGLYRDGICKVAVVLTDMSQSGHAIEVVKEALEPVTACDHLTVHPVKGDFTYVQLKQWHRAGQQLLRIEGVRAVTINYQLNRLVITVAGRSVVREVLAALPTLDIPAAAVTFQVGNAPGRG